MPQLMTARDMFPREYPQVRSRLLDIAASLDRIEAAMTRSDAGEDDRMKQLRRAIETLLQPGGDRAARVQMVFSDAYDPAWRVD